MFASFYIFIHGDFLSLVSSKVSAVNYMRIVQLFTDEGTEMHIMRCSEKDPYYRPSYIAISYIEIPKLRYIPFFFTKFSLIEYPTCHMKNSGVKII